MRERQALTREAGTKGDVGHGFRFLTAKTIFLLRILIFTRWKDIRIKVKNKNERGTEVGFWVSAFNDKSYTSGALQLVRGI